MAWSVELESAFHPKVVAVVGVPSDARREEPRLVGGAAFIRAFEQLGFPGRICPVNPGATDILGYKAYPSVGSLPEPPDLVIVAAPAKFVPDILENCVASNVKNVHVYTAGFEETGDEEARELGRQVREIAIRGGLRMIGPNCMGLYVPAAGIGFFDGMPKESGPVSFVSQSGGHCNWFGHYAPNYGIHFSKVISFGNAYILDSTDFLEYLAVDPETKVICMYLEGVKDGGRLLGQVREINRFKPVILWKGGLTKVGSRAVASHTASLAGQEGIWRGFFAQTGAVPVYSLEEMAEVTMSFLNVNLPKGKAAAVIGAGGGTSVAAADICSREGLDIPPLSPSTQDELKKFIRLAGASIKNPLDTGLLFRDVSLLAREVEVVAADPGIDMVILMPHLDMARFVGSDQINKMVSFLCDLTRINRFGKPVVIAFHSFSNNPWEREQRFKLRVELSNKGVAVYDSLAGASRALAKLHEYSRIQNALTT